MKSKITLLITASVIGLIALSVIQAYLINNTYELRKDSFIKETRESVSSIDDHLTKIDSMRSVWRDHLLENTTAYKKGEIERDSILLRFRKRTTMMNDDFIRIFRSELHRNGINPDLKFQKKVRSIVILDTLKNDTLFYSALNPESYILGEDFNSKGYGLSSSTSYSEYTFSVGENGGTVSETVGLNFETQTLMSIDGWERKVLAEMRGLLVSSVAIFLFVFGLLFFSIKSLITQRKIAEIKTDFVNNISHEFKTPLATLTLATGMLREESGEKKSIEGTLGIIDRQNRRLQRLLDQVLDNTLDYDEIALSKEKVLARDFLTTLFDDFVVVMQNENLEMIQELELEKQSICIDKFHLTTAIGNILENAIKYNNDEELILHCRARVGETLQISIQDNGIGISERDQKNLFEKFYRVGDKEVHEVKGLGLGLYYANQIIKAHGGKIDVESKLGEETTFIVELPLNQI